jgi:hypothetical protein
VPRIEPGSAEAIASDATRTGQMVGVRFAEIIDDKEGVAPWTRLSSGRTPTKRIAGPLPSVVKAVARPAALHREGGAAVFRY